MRAPARQVARRRRVEATKRVCVRARRRSAAAPAPPRRSVRGVALLLTMVTGGMVITAGSILLYPVAYFYDDTFRLIHE